MRAAEARAPEGQGQIVAQQLALGAAGAQSLEAVARAGAELAQQSAQRTGHRGDQGRRLWRGDCHLIGGRPAPQRLRLAPDAPVARAMDTALRS